jgi:hypothetical protein
MNSELNSKFLNSELIVKLLNDLPALPPDPGPGSRAHLCRTRRTADLRAYALGREIRQPAVRTPKAQPRSQAVGCTI